MGNGDDVVDDVSSMGVAMGDIVKIEKQIVKTREVKNLNLFTHKNMYVHAYDKFRFVT